MNDIKSCLYQHFFTRKNHFILGKPPLTINKYKENFTISAEYKDGAPWFKLDHGFAHIYFTDIDNIVEFIEKHKKETK